MNPVFSYIYQHPLFSEEDLKKLSESHIRVEFKKGDFLLKEGETSDEYYLLEEGLVSGKTFQELEAMGTEKAIIDELKQINEKNILCKQSNHWPSPWN